DVTFERTTGMRRFTLTPRVATDSRGIGPQPDSAGVNPTQPDVRLVLTPALPLDARVRSVSINGRAARFAVDKQGDSQFVRIDVGPIAAAATVAVTLDEGTEVFRGIDAAPAGESNRGLRIIRARATGSTLSLLAEGLAGERYPIDVRTPRQIGVLPHGVTIVRDAATVPDAQRLEVSFEGTAGEYLRREIDIPLR
ncbi:MAG TPA: hypothetical protein VJK00_01195, partial [Steroidobacteraceae bacterium]|nr:hypothetical protein [Steroidobacteraceae bacterium]